MPRLGTLKPRLAVLDTRTAKPPPKQADPELLTEAHRVWRLAVMQRAGWRCQAPGCTVQGGRGGQRLFADHIVERQDGGDPLDVANGQALCGRHHSLKTAAARARRMGEAASSA
jgi:hypothetical protein